MPITFDVVPPNDQTKFESVPGYEWANRLTQLIKSLNLGGGAFPQASYVTMGNDPDLDNERVLTAGTGITIVDSGPNGTVTVNSTGGGSPVDATYVVMSLNSVLTQERVLTAGSNIIIADGGANAPVTVSSDALGVGWAFADGSDGAFIYDGVSTPAWATLVGSVYTLITNVYHTTAVINSGITVQMGQAGSTGPWQMYCSVSLTGADLTSKITLNGVSATGISGGAANSTGGGMYQFPGGGGAGNAGAGTVGFGSLRSLGGAGGKGGNGGSGAGGAGGGSTVPASQYGGLHGIYIPMGFWTGQVQDLNTYGAGAGGGGGGGNGVNNGAGGGSGGGIIGVFAKRLLGSGTFEVIGGDGAPATTNPGTNKGGGGAGGGGCVLVVTVAAHLWTTNLVGGKGGVGMGTGQTGVDGSPGNYFLMIL
jgi:hypothetical protein